MITGKHLKTFFRRFRSWTLPSKCSVIAIPISVIFYLFPFDIIYDNVKYFIGNPKELQIIIRNDENTRFLHIYSVQRRQHNGVDLPSVYEYATWYKIRIYNASPDGKSITDVIYNNGVDKILESVPVPFFKKVYYPGARITLNDPISLPINIGPNEFIEFYALLPVVVPKLAAPILLHTSRYRDSQIDTNVELFLFGEEPIFKTNSHVTVVSDGKEQAVLDGSLITPRHLGNLWVDRNLLYIRPEGIRFIDYDEKPKDGFFYKKTIETFSNVINTAREMGIDSQEIMNRAFQHILSFLSRPTGDK